jgi:hypothetical protein
MGYLTTFTIHNDGIDLIKEYPEEFCRKLHEASSSMAPQEFGIGYYANLVKVQRPRDSDDSTLYVHMDNELTEIRPLSTQFVDLIWKHPRLVDKIIIFLEIVLDDIKSLKNKSSI